MIIACFLFVAFALGMPQVSELLPIAGTDFVVPAIKKSGLKPAAKP